MIDAVFISDLHLHPDETAINERFNAFLQWAEKNTQQVYILGDFFHVWSGDDGLNAWSESIALRLAELVNKGISVYFMPGNRDFLLGQRFASLAKLQLLIEPTVIQLGKESILLVHGDRYCTLDTGHQWLRRLTRNWVFSRFFLTLPLILRQRFVNEVRQRSQMNRKKPMMKMDVVAISMLKHMKRFNVRTVIHGHIHKPGLTTHTWDGDLYKQYVLSDWDEDPHILCYNKTNNLFFCFINTTDNF